MKRRGAGHWLYVKIAILNIATAVMFFSISQSVPIPQTYLINSKNISSVQQKPIKIGFPNRLVIKSIGMDLNVIKGSFDAKTGEWTLSESDAFYADNSVPPNNSNGMTLIYGHGKPPVFGDLQKIQDGAEAIVYSDTGYVFHYKYQSVKWVSPNDIGIFTQYGEPQLMLQTCAGPYDSYRALYSFNLIGVDGA